MMAEKGIKSMKLLIVDDEVLTRTGLITSLNWKHLGIRKILQADDGLNALKVARVEKPDIILSDIRMPRLNGIQMAEQLESILPDTIIIFMSGYSDKEYLKAAIKLKAVCYVEKPLNPREIEEAVIEAKSIREKMIRTRKNETLYTLESASKLAYLLTKPNKELKSEIEQLISSLPFDIHSDCNVTTYIIKIRSSHFEREEMNRGINEMIRLLKPYHLHVLYTTVHGIHHVFHIISEREFSIYTYTSIETHFLKLFSCFEDFFLIKGESVTSLSKTYQSYTSAVLLLQSSFFFPSKSILCTSDKKPSFNSSKHQLQLKNFQVFFMNAIEEKNHQACMDCLNEMYSCYFKNTSLLPNQVKDLYYKLFIGLNESYKDLHISLNPLDEDLQNTMIEYLDHSFTYMELHQILIDKVDEYFSSLSSYTPENSIIFMIKDYISKNYSNDMLSIKEISEYVSLSVSYLCTYFKSQNGQTINQYITEYRMKKAKQLLSDPRYQIADISSIVGYSNSNYFSKSFKKFTGLSPSNYREKIIP